MLDSGTLAELEVSGAAESLSIREKVVVCPATGRFQPFPAEVLTTEGEWVEPGQVLGEVITGTAKTPVRSEFRGWMMGMLVIPGQPVRRGEGLFWIWGR